MSSELRPTAVITGASGQLGTELRKIGPPGWRVVSCSAAELDVARLEPILALVEREQPSAILNAAAYTAVDAAEDEPDRAYAVNATGAANLALAACRVGARLIHVSTDFVFDGAHGRPYAPNDPPNPLGAYGRSKLQGEVAVMQASGGDALVVRTSWVYSGHGRNFVLRMLQRMREGQALGVVSDQVGAPTWARSLAHALWSAAARSEVRGIHHWSDAGVASWYDLAVAVQEEALALGLLDRPVPVRPIRTADYPTRARRPSYSVLDTSETRGALGLAPPHWRVNLRSMLLGLVNA